MITLSYFLWKYAIFAPSDESVCVCVCVLACCAYACLCVQFKEIWQTEPGVNTETIRALTEANNKLLQVIYLIQGLAAFSNSSLTEQMDSIASRCSTPSLIQGVLVQIRRLTELDVEIKSLRGLPWIQLSRNPHKSPDNLQTTA